MKSVTSIRRQ